MNIIFPSSLGINRERREREGTLTPSRLGREGRGFSFSHSLALQKQPPLSYSRLLLTLFIHLLSLSSKKTKNWLKNPHHIPQYSSPHCSMICKFHFPPPCLRSCFTFYLGLTFSPCFCSHNSMAFFVLGLDLILEIESYFSGCLWV